MKKYSNNKHKGYLFAIIAPIFFGSSGLFVKQVQGSGLDSISILSLQYMISVPILWIISFIKYRSYIKLDKKTFFKIFILGMFITSSTNTFYYQSFKYLDMSIATILLFTHPILITVYSFIFSKEKPNKIIWVSLFMAFSGCILILDLLNIHRSISMIGILFGMAASITCAFLNIFLETFDEKTPSFILVTYTSTFAFISYNILRLLISPPLGQISSIQIINIALLALICQIPPMFLLYTAIRYIGAVKASIICNLEIPIASLFGYFIYHETLSFLQILGIFFVIGGIILIKNSQAILNYLSPKQYKKNKP